MSWEVELQCPCCEQTYPTSVEPYRGTEMNVTWNYSDDIRKLFPRGFKETFDGLTGKESEMLLEMGVIEFGGKIPDVRFPYSEENYNVGTVFAVMLVWARLNMNGVWKIY